jgi:hypothetical protein
MRAKLASLALISATVACGGRTTLDDLISAQPSIDSSAGDVSSTDGGADGTGSGGCFSLISPRGAEVCEFVTSDIPDFVCPLTMAGSCPSGGLEGCCVELETASGYSTTAAACFYSSDPSWPTAREACAPVMGDGTTSTWQTTSP